MNLELHYKRMYPDMIKTFTFRTGNLMDAEDIVQEAFLRAIKYLPSYNEELATFDKWFGTIINNVWKDYLRDKRDAGVTRETEEDDGSVEIPEDIYGIIEKSISKYSGVQKECLTHFFISGYTHKEIAQLVNTTSMYSRKCVSNFMKEVFKNA